MGLVALDENLGSSHSQLSRIAGIDLQALFVPDKSRDSLPRKLLHIAKMADPDPAWRNHFRDPDVSRDRQRLIKLAGDAAKAEPPAHQLAIVGMLLFSFNARADRARLIRMRCAAVRKIFGSIGNWAMPCIATQSTRKP